MEKVSTGQEKNWGGCISRGMQVSGQEKRLLRLVPCDDTRFSELTVMIPANETFPFAPHFTTKLGFQIHYVDKGTGEPLVCLHGEPIWGYLYRKLVPPLSTTHRLIAPYHMGFGKSETPQDHAYTYLSHVQNIEALLNDELDSKT